MRSYLPIRGRDVDGSYLSPVSARERAARLRRERADLGLCINGEGHGKATHGCRCEACYEKHRGSAR